MSGARGRPVLARRLGWLSLAVGLVVALVALLPHLQQTRWAWFAQPPLALLLGVLAGGACYAGGWFGLVRPARRLVEAVHECLATAEDDAAPPPADAGEDEITAALAAAAWLRSQMQVGRWRAARLAALRQGIGKLGHDLRGALSPALLTAERLQTNPDASVQRAGEIMMRSVDRATELVSAAVEYAREAPAPRPRTRLALRRVVAEAAAQVRRAAPLCAVENAVPEQITVEADPADLALALRHLLDNAALAGASLVRVSAHAAGGQVALTVTDNGPGLPESVAQHAFRPFVSGGRAGGAGLGLATARDLLRANGGELVLEESGPAGTTFRLTLPTPTRGGAAATPPPGRH